MNRENPKASALSQTHNMFTYSYIK